MHEQSIKEEVMLPYVFTFFPNLRPMRGWCCDRSYAYMDDHSWLDVRLKDIIEVHSGFVTDDNIDFRKPPCQLECRFIILDGLQRIMDGLYHWPPHWAEALIDSGERYITCWTNYYE